MNNASTHPDWRQHPGHSYQLQTMVHIRYPITLFQRADAPTRWTMRYRVGPHTFSRSTRKADFADASEVAVRSFISTQTRFDEGLPISPYRVNEAVTAYCAYIDEQIDLRDRVTDNQGVTAKDGKQKKNAIRRYFLGYFNGKQIASITPNDIEAFWSWRYTYWTNGPGRKVLDDPVLRREQRIVSDPGEPSRHTLITEGQVISAVLQLAVKNERIGKRDVFDATPPARMGAGSVPHPYFERDELTRLLVFVLRRAKSLEGKRPDQFFAWHRWAGLIALSAYSGADPSEVLNLKVDDLVRIPSKDVHGVSRDYYECRVEGKRTRRIGRQHKRDVTILSEATQFIEQWLAVRKAHEFPKDDEGYLFPSPNGRRLENASQLFKRVLEEWEDGSRDPRTNREWVMYSFRHTFCTLMIKHKNVSFDTLAKMMGHKNTNMIHEHYAHITPSDYIDQLSAEALTKINTEGLMRHTTQAGVLGRKAREMEKEKSSRKALLRAEQELLRKAEGH